MRLDHLLSKEHHPPKGGMGPAARGCRVGVLNGGDTGKFGAGNGRETSSTATSVVGTSSWCGW